MANAAVYLDELSYITSIDSLLSPVNKSLAESILDQCFKYCKCKYKDRFAGCQPISLDIENRYKLTEYTHYVTYKADGTRYLVLIIDTGRVYLIRRDNSVFSVPSLSFPSSSSPTGHVRNSLIDAELVMDERQGGVFRPLLLMYDIVAYEGDNSVGEMYHSKRIEVLQTAIINPRLEAMRQRQISFHNETFAIDIVNFWKLQECEYLYKTIAPTLSFKTDGLVFTREDKPYMPGTNAHFIKWKEPEMISIDYRFELQNYPVQLNKAAGTDNKGVLKVALKVKNGCKEELSRIVDIYNISSAIPYEELNGRIVECTWDRSINRMTVIKVRSDKNKPNSKFVADKTMLLIRNPITFEDLIYYINRNNNNNNNNNNNRIKNYGDKLDSACYISGNNSQYNIKADNNSNNVYRGNNTTFNTSNNTDHLTNSFNFESNQIHCNFNNTRISQYKQNNKRYSNNKYKANTNNRQ